MSGRSPYDAVSFAVENGIMSGYNATKFGPNDTLTRAVEKGIIDNVPFTHANEPATRAQAAQMLTNFLRVN